MLDREQDNLIKLLPSETLLGAHNRWLCKDLLRYYDVLSPTNCFWAEIVSTHLSDHLGVLSISAQYYDDVHGESDCELPLLFSLGEFLDHTHLKTNYTKQKQTFLIADTSNSLSIVDVVKFAFGRMSGPVVDDVSSTNPLWRCAKMFGF